MDLQKIKEKTKPKEFKQNIINEYNSDITKLNNNDDNIQTKSDESLSSTPNYTSDIRPLKHEMNHDANHAPRSYIKAFNLNNFNIFDYENSHQDFIKNENQLYHYTDSSYRKMMNIPPHFNV